MYQDIYNCICQNTKKYIKIYKKKYKKIILKKNNSKIQKNIKFFKKIKKISKHHLKPIQVSRCVSHLRPGPFSTGELYLSS